MSAELPACPFCGGAGVVWKSGAVEQYNFSAVICAECDARTDYYETEAEAVAAWSRRVEPQPASGNTDFQRLCQLSGQSEATMLDAILNILREDMNEENQP